MFKENNKNPEEFLDGELDKESEGELKVDACQTDNEIVIQSIVAGVLPEDLEINITTESVTIRGKREREEKVEAKDYLYQECFWGSFSRQILLPEDADASRIKASLQKGVITIKIPRVSKIKKRKINVSLGE